jgi:murein DD-endopeptidase MepM/ murein hydrolase activator NlpD
LKIVLSIHNSFYEEKILAITLSALILSVLFPIGLFHTVPVHAEYSSQTQVNQNDGKKRIFIFPTIGTVTQYFYPGHYALDIANSEKPAVWAVGDGVVIKAVNICENVSQGCGCGYGNYVIIDHGNGLKTLYGHLDSVSVKKDDLVKQGDVIGIMGRSGTVPGETGVLLHFEVSKEGLKQNPLDYLSVNQN